MHKAPVLLASLLCLPFIHAQTKTRQNVRDMCLSFTPEASRSCHSFTELLSHQDRQLLSLLESGSKGTSLVCFAEGVDRFLVVVAFLPPGKIGFLAHDEYRNGMRESNHRQVSLQWHAPAGSSDHTYPEGWWMPPDGVYEHLYEGDHVAPLKTVGTVDPAEISLAYSINGQHGGTTDYKLYIRRSTNRFVEEYDGADGSPRATGHCLQWQR